MDTSQLTVLATAVVGIKDQLISVIGIVAIPAVIVLGAVLIWHFGINFFRRLGK